MMLLNSVYNVFSKLIICEKIYRIYIMISKMWKKIDFFFDIYKFKNFILYFVLNLW